MVWNRNLGATQIVLRQAETDLPVVASAPAGSHPNHQWRVFHFQFGGEHDAQIAIFSNGIAGVPVSLPAALPDGSPIDLPLQLGGDGESGPFFYGGFAELIVFKRALTMVEQIGVLNYLREKYGL